MEARESLCEWSSLEVKPQELQVRFAFGKNKYLSVLQ